MIITAEMCWTRAIEWYIFCSHWTKKMFWLSLSRIGLHLHCCDAVELFFFIVVESSLSYCSDVMSEPKKSLSGASQLSHESFQSFEEGEMTLDGSCFEREWNISQTNEYLVRKFIYRSARDWSSKICAKKLYYNNCIWSKLALVWVLGGKGFLIWLKY